MAQHCIFWPEEYQVVLRFVNRDGPIDTEQLAAKFAGLEEAAYYSLIMHYNIRHPPRRPRPRNLPFAYPPRTLEQRETMRMIRFYATYQVSKLDPKTIEKFVKSENREALMPKLIQKFGPEPVTLKDVKTRIRVFLAAYGLWDKVPSVERTISQMYSGDEEAYLRRLVAEHGAEPQEPDASESYDYRSRARRFLTLKDPASLPRLENILQRFEGKEIEMMALLQRRYGKEPTEREVQEGLSKLDAAYQKKQQELKEKREREAKERAEKQRKQEEQREQKMTSIGVYNWDTGDVSVLRELPHGVKRAPVMDEIRAAIKKGWRLKESRCIELTRQVLSYYNRPLSQYAERFVMNRVATDVDERMEFLAFLEHSYVNSLPLSATESLRTVVSLLEMKVGAKSIAEVEQAGGVNQYLKNVDAASEGEWSSYMRSVYGQATEDELAMRNRVRNIMMRNKPGTTAAQLDVEIHNYATDTVEKAEKAGKPTTYLQVLKDYLGRLCARYGSEPPLPIVLDRERVLKLLDRNAPGKMDKIDVILQAHAFPGDTKQQALDRVIRSYGEEQNDMDAVVAAFDADELEDRFKVWSQQNRLRNVFARRLKALENPDMDVLQSVIETTAKYSDANKQQASAEAAKEAAKQAQAAAQAAAQQSAADDFGDDAATPEEALAHRERAARNAIATTWRQDLMAITENVPHLAHLLDWHIEVEEIFKRHREYYEAVAKYKAFRAQMVEEEEELREWLKARLVWRDQWQRDEVANAEKRRREQDKQRILEEEAMEERRRKDTEAAAEAQAHFQAMQDLRENLHTQATKVLQYQAKIKSLQTRGHLGLTRNTIDVEAHRHLHDGCVFNKNPAYNTNVKPLEIVVVDDRDWMKAEAAADDADPATMDSNSWEYKFKSQCRQYVESLLKAYDPSRLPKLDDIMRRYNNKEHDLIAALEQQFDVDKGRQSDLVDRVKEYYQRMAPDRMEEMDTVLRRFNCSAEHVWPFLYSQYGAHPRRRGPELRESLRVRLGSYLAKHAPKLLVNVDQMIDQCPDLGCESLFRMLTEKYGPEDDRQELINIERKLKIFYSKRGLHDMVKDAGKIARRFAGKTKLLNEVLSRNFGSDLSTIREDT